LTITRVGSSRDSADNSPTTTTRGNHSPVVKAEARIEGEKIRGWVTNVLLALCIMALIASFFMWRYAAMIQDLKRWDLDSFKQTEWTELKAQVKSDHDLVQAYGLQKAVHDAVREEAEEKDARSKQKLQRSR
jgi:hypothetical protein